MKPQYAPSVMNPMGISFRSIFDDDEPVDSVKPDYHSWSITGDGYVKLSFARAAKLPRNIYEIKSTDKGYLFKSVQFPSDNLLLLPGMPNKFILDQIDEFWGREEAFKKCGLIHKRGILMYGPAGCGKTSIIRMLCNNILEKDGIVVSMGGDDNPYTVSEGLADLRKIEPKRQILLLIEDIDSIMKEYGEGNALLSLLDGEKQLESIVYLATTNNPQELEDRIIKRPGRFDLVIGLNPPTKEARKVYLKSLVKDAISETELEEVAEKTHGMGIAHLREFVVAWICLGLDRQETLARLKDNIKNTPKIHGAKEFGFTVNYVEEKKNDTNPL